MVGKEYINSPQINPFSPRTICSKCPKLALTTMKKKKKKDKYITIKDKRLLCCKLKYLSRFLQYVKTNITTHKVLFATNWLQLNKHGALLWIESIKGSNKATYMIELQLKHYVSVFILTNKQFLQKMNKNQA